MNAEESVLYGTRFYRELYAILNSMDYKSVYISVDDAVCQEWLWNDDNNTINVVNFNQDTELLFYINERLFGSFNDPSYYDSNGSRARIHPWVIKGLYSVNGKLPVAMMEFIDKWGIGV